MNYDVINYYMEVHDFLPCDKWKIKNFIEIENSIRSDLHKFVGGYLTRTKLCLVTGFGTSEEYSRIFLGVQNNFK